MVCSRMPAGRVVMVFAFVLSTLLMACAVNSSNAEASSNSFQLAALNKPLPFMIGHSATRTVMPSERGGMRELVLLFGGYVGGQQQLSDQVLAMDLKDASWSRLAVQSVPGAEGPLPRAFHASASPFGHVPSTMALQDRIVSSGAEYLMNIDDDNDVALLIHGGKGRKSMLGISSVYGDLFALTNSGKGMYEWQEIAPSGSPPSPRSGHCAVSMKNRFFVFGGWDGSRFLNDVYELSWKGRPTVENIRRGVWRKLVTRGDAPGPRHQHSCVMEDSLTMLVLGGEGRDSHIFSDHFRLRLTPSDREDLTALWSRSPSGEAGPLSSHAAASSVAHLGTKAARCDVVVCGGVRSLASPRKPSASCFLLSPKVKESLVMLLDLPDGGVTDGRMVAGESGEFWVIGGNAHRDSQPDACPLYKLKLASHKDFENIAVIQSLTWEELRTGGADHPSPRFAASFHQVGEKLVLLYGRSSGQGLLKRSIAHNDVYSLVPSGGYKWTKLSIHRSAPTPRFFHASTVQNGNIIIFGGESPSTFGSGTLLNDIAMLDTNTMIWKPMLSGGDLPIPRRHAALVSMRKERADRILLIGGETSMGPIGDIHEYNPSSGSWKYLTIQNGNPEPLYGHSATVFRDSIIIISSSESVVQVRPWTGEWKNIPSRGAAFPGLRFHTANIVHREPNQPILIVTGGEDAQTGTCNPFTYALSLETLEWRKWASPSFCRFHHAVTNADMAGVGNVLYSFGGLRMGREAGELMSLRLDSEAWQPISRSPLPSSPLHGSESPTLVERSTVESVVEAVPKRPAIGQLEPASRPTSPTVTQLHTTVESPTAKATSRIIQRKVVLTQRDETSNDGDSRDINKAASGVASSLSALQATMHTGKASILEDAEVLMNRIVAHTIEKSGTTSTASEMEESVQAAIKELDDLLLLMRRLGEQKRMFKSAKQKLEEEMNSYKTSASKEKDILAELGSFGDVLPSMIEKHKRAMVDCEEAASEVIAMKETEQQAQADARALFDKIEAKEAEIADIERSKTMKQEEISLLQRSIDEAIANRDRSERELKRLEANLAECRAAQENLVSKLQAAEEELQRLANEANSNARRQKELTKKTVSLKGLRDMLERPDWEELQHILESVLSLEQQVDLMFHDLEMDNIIEGDAVSECDLEVADRTLNKRSRWMSALAMLQDKLDEEAQKMTNDIAVLDRSLLLCKQRVSTIEEEIEKNQLDCNEMDHKIAMLKQPSQIDQESIIRSRKRIQLLQEENENLEREGKLLKRDLVVLLEEETALQERRKSRDGESSRLQHNLSRLRNERDSVGRELSRYLDRYQALKDQLEKVKTAKSTAAATLRRRTAEMSAQWEQYEDGSRLQHKLLDCVMEWRQ